jgi:hypothetical protein
VNNIVNFPTEQVQVEAEMQRAAESSEKLLRAFNEGYLADDEEHNATIIQFPVR